MLVEGTLYKIVTYNEKLLTYVLDLLGNTFEGYNIHHYQLNTSDHYIITPFLIDNYLTEVFELKLLNYHIGDIIQDQNDGSHYFVCVNNMGCTKINHKTGEIFPYSVFYTN